jgi:hypothetical protein
MDLPRFRFLRFRKTLSGSPSEIYPIVFTLAQLHSISGGWGGLL